MHSIRQSPSDYFLASQLGVYRNYPQPSFRGILLPLYIVALIIGGDYIELDLASTYLALASRVQEAYNRSRELPSILSPITYILLLANFITAIQRSSIPTNAIGSNIIPSTIVLSSDLISPYSNISYKQGVALLAGFKAQAANYIAILAIPTILIAL